MIGLDCNILVQLAFADHPAHAKTLAAVQNETQAGVKLVFPSLVINEFLHVSTDDKRFAPPLSMSDALDWVEELLKSPAVSLVEPNQTTWTRQSAGCANLSWAVNAFWTPILQPYFIPAALTDC
jgi:predicted nucleic acid-binding protein